MTTLYLARKYCRHGGHDWPADDFYALPIDKQGRKRMVCSRCHAKILEAREQKKKEGALG